ncbi:unnamed protein product [Nezara viridula]|uniref:Uncharacterized protein n=1 Tax=Nezara viridula TaxID=85310 RepID=A0A9P0H7E1_NEZVI|nr:unnamed protein product [Nezara viridula]
MEKHCNSRSSTDRRSNKSLKQWRTLRMGSFVANALEFLSTSKRGAIIKKLHDVQDLYRDGGEWILGEHSKLSWQLLRLEHCRMDPERYADPDRSHDVPLSYSDALITFVASLPGPNRELFLNDLCNLIAKVISDVTL